MLRLITLGRIELTDASGRPVEAILKRPKNLALLAYLAVTGAGSTRSRDTVVGLFWPELPQAKARQALNQAIYFLRRELGRDVMVSVGNDQIGVAAGALWCDAVAVRSAVASGDQRSAQTHYRGEFLPGFYLAEAPEFEKWLDTERDALQRLASSSAWKLAEEAAAAGDVETAAAAAVRSAELSLREEAAVRRAIELLGGLGERARALDLYRELEAELAEDFGTSPAPETQAVVARVRAREPEPEVAELLGRASEAVGAASSAEAGTTSARPRWKWDGAAEPVASAPRPEASGRLSRRALIAVPIVALLAASALFWALTRSSGAASTYTATDPHLMIEPFDALASDERLLDIAGSITDALAAELADVEGIEVMLVQPGNAPSADSAARALAAPDTGSRAWFLVRGRVSRDGDLMRAAISLIDPETGGVIATTSIERMTQDPMSFVDEASDDAARFARAAIGRELSERIWRSSTTDVTAARMMERAEADRREGIALLSRGAPAAAQAAFAAADSLLAEVEQRAPRWTAPIILRAQVAVERMWAALLPPVHDMAASAEFATLGLAHAERAVALDTTDARAREMEGVLLFWRLQLEPMSPDSAVAIAGRVERTLRAAVALDPERAAAWNTLSAFLEQRGQYEGSYYAAKQAHEADAFLDHPLEILGRLFDGAFETGDDAVAREHCRDGQQRFPTSPFGASCALMMLGWSTPPASPDEARAIVQGAGLDPSDYMLPFLELQEARILARAGEADSARALMRRALARAPSNEELLPYAATVYLGLNEQDSASALLRRFVDVDPTTRQGLLFSRRFAELRE